MNFYLFVLDNKMPLSLINATKIDLIRWAQLNDFDDLVSAISDHKLTGRSLTRLSCTTIEQMFPEVGVRLLFEDLVFKAGAFGFYAPRNTFWHRLNKFQTK
jgi:hypothetical protein